MKSISRIAFILYTAIVFNQPCLSQIPNKSLEKSNKMDNTKYMDGGISNFSDKKENPEAIYFIDKFSVPKASIEEFVIQMNYNRAFLKTLAGYLGGQAFEQYNNEGNLAIITITGWENIDQLNKAKTAVQSEFKRIGFNPVDFYQRLNIKMERGQYQNFKE
jgi:hypothetical protein